MKVYEGLWSCMKVYEGLWSFMKVYEGLWRFMKFYEGVWKCMKVYEGAWRCMKVHEGAWRSMKVYERLWRCMMVYEGLWKGMKVYEGAWWCMKVYEGVWRCMKLYEGVWRCMKVYESVWRCMNACTGHRIVAVIVIVKPVVRLRATLQYCHTMLVLSILIDSLPAPTKLLPEKTVFILEYCELTAMASNITSVSKREKVISLRSSGYRNQEMCSRLHHLSHQTVSNILSKFLQNEMVTLWKSGWKERTIATPDSAEFEEYCKVFKPSIRSFERQQGLLANAVSTRCLTFADCRLQTADCRLQTADCRLQTADYRLHQCTLQTAVYRLQTAYSGPQTVDIRDIDWLLAANPCRFEIMTLWPREGRYGYVLTV